MKIDIHGAKVHNLKDVDVSIPKEKLTVVTGLSGSGKGSLAFDTLYAEGQRRYVESLSSYARQFLGRLDKPDVDRIDGLSPAVAIEQRSASGGPRSTVATRTEIMDHLRMLFARIGVTKSSISGEVVRKDRVTDVVNHILTCGAERMILVAPLAPREDRSPEDQLRVLQQQGYTRVWTAEGAMRMDSLDGHDVLGLVVDRFSPQSAAEDEGRVADSVETALFEGGGRCQVWTTSETAEPSPWNSTTASNGTAWSSLSPPQTCSTSTALSGRAEHAKVTDTCSASTPTKLCLTRPEACTMVRWPRGAASAQDGGASAWSWPPVPQTFLCTRLGRS